MFQKQLRCSLIPVSFRSLSVSPSFDLNFNLLMFVSCSKLIDQMMLILPAMYQNDQGDFGITIKCGGTEWRSVTLTVSHGQKLVNIGARTKVMGRRNFHESIIVSINKRCIFFKCLNTINSNHLLFTQYVYR